MLDNYLLRPAVLKDVWVEMNPITGKVTLHVEYTDHNFNSHISRDGINLFLEVARMLKSHIGETIVDFKGLDDVGFYVLFKESDERVTMFNTEKKHLLYVNSYMERSLAKRASIPKSNRVRSNVCKW